jgi:hypothetical protein
MSEPNGRGKSRLDRIEEMIERHERANEAAHQRFLAENEAAHQRFEEEDKRLLTSQILMNDAMQKMLGAVERMADGMKSLELKMEETTGKLNALIDTVDGIIRKRAE